MFGIDKAIDEFNKEQGFILKPETYNQKEWYEVFMNLLKEYRQKCNIINELEKDLWEVRQLTFTKYNSNEWNNCLSFNDDIKPILDKLKELKEGNK